MSCLIIKLYQNLITIHKSSRTHFFFFFYINKPSVILIHISPSLWLPMCTVNSKLKLKTDSNTATNNCFKLALSDISCMQLGSWLVNSGGVFSWANQKARGFFCTQHPTLKHTSHKYNNRFALYFTWFHFEYLYTLTNTLYVFKKFDSINSFY